MAREQRRLAAIIAADVVGYSRLMGRDESGTLARLREHRKERLEPALARYGGRLVKLTGDGALAEFPSAVDALGAAIEFQQAMIEVNRDQPENTVIAFRIGLHIGDLIVDGDDLYGDGVNVAARLEAEAPPSGIMISRTVHEAVVGRLKATFADLGGLALKNIERPIQVFEVKWDPTDWKVSAAATEAPSIGPTPPIADVPLTLPDKPSIAVLPFQNISGEPEQDYFADGMVEDIITALSRFKSLFVIARNSSFAYKGRSLDIKHIGRELGVRYILEGSLRKAGERVRIVAQLIDSASGVHLWADRFDGGLGDVFGLQDQVTTGVVGQIAPKLEQAEIERSTRKPTGSLDAYDFHLRAVAHFYKGDKDSIEEALRLFYRAIEIDPTFASAYGMATRCYTWRKSNGWRDDATKEVAEMKRLARAAVVLGRDDAVALCTGAFGLAHAGDLDEAAACIDRAIALNPNLGLTWFHSGWVRAWRGEPELAIEHFTRVMRLSPIDPLTPRIHAGIAFSHFLGGRYEEARRWAVRSVHEQPNFAVGVRILAASCALAGHIEQARRIIADLRAGNPTQRIASVKEWAPFSRPDDLVRFEGALRLAGLPD